jgi:hypothetical protein
LYGADGQYTTDAAGNGTSVSGGADADGDGQPDLLIAAHDSITGGGAAGIVYWMSGTPEGEYMVPDVADWVGTADEAGDALGVALDAGDIDGDGLADLAFGAPYSDASGVDSGAVYLVSGPPSGDFTLGVDGLTIRATDAGDELGQAVAAGGDLNGDGIGDLLVGAPRADDGASGAGAAYLWYGPITGSFDATSADVRIYGDDTNDYAGCAVDFAGDVNGDGAEDLILGAYSENATASNAGMAFLFYSLATSATYASTADARLSGESAEDRAGYVVTGLGDLEEDGFADVAVSSHYRNGFSGAAYVVMGPVYGLLSLGSADAILEGEAAGDAAGIDLSGAGDVSGDGFVDLVVGATYSDRVVEDAGAVYLFQGGSW